MTSLTFFRKTCIFIVFSLVFPFNSIFAADLILSAPPRESHAEGQKIYGPFAAYLSKVLKRKVTYGHPGNWFSYQINMRKDKYDIIFDGPHFNSWRAAHLGHEILAKLPGSLKFILVTHANNYKINKPKDMIGKTFCGMSPPNLSSLSFLASFKNPILQPEVKGIHGGMTEVFKTFAQDGCPAAVLRDTFYNKALTQEKRDKLKIIFNSSAFPNQAISASKRLSSNEKNKIIDALSTKEGASATQQLIKRFGSKTATSFVKTNNVEYEGYNSYLEGVMFGW